MTSGFREGDIISRIGEPGKWLVWEVYSDGIELKDMAAYLDDEISDDDPEWDSRYVWWNEVEKEWVKVGVWSFKLEKEMP